MSTNELGVRVHFKLGVKVHFVHFELGENFHSDYIELASSIVTSQYNRSLKKSEQKCFIKKNSEFQNKDMKFNPTLTKPYTT